MPRPNDYPRWRYITMQASMWGVLLCTVGIAALASNYKRGATLVTLAEPQLIDSISVKLPKGWIIDRRGDGTITVSDDAEATRIIDVQEREVTWVDRLADATINSTSGKQKRSIRMGPINGQLREKRSRSRTGPRSDILELEAIGTLKNGNVLSITLSQLVESQRDESDALELLTKIADSVQYVSQ